jgi:hypothetical protein
MTSLDVMKALSGTDRSRIGADLDKQVNRSRDTIGGLRAMAGVDAPAQGEYSKSVDRLAALMTQSRAGHSDGGNTINAREKSMLGESSAQTAKAATRDFKAKLEDATTFTSPTLHSEQMLRTDDGYSMDSAGKVRDPEGKVFALAIRDENGAFTGEFVSGSSLSESKPMSEAEQAAIRRGVMRATKVNIDPRGDGSLSGDPTKAVPTRPERPTAKSGPVGDPSPASTTPTAAPPEAVDAFKKAYRDATGSEVTQAHLELVGYTKAIRQPEFSDLIRKQGAAVADRYKEMVGREPTQREKEYWVQASTNLEMMGKSVGTIQSLSKADIEATAAKIKSTPPWVRGAPAGDLPSTPTAQGLIGAKQERDWEDAHQPLVNPSFVKTAADAAAFERLRETSLSTRGIDIMNTPTSANWAEQMIRSGAASADNLNETKVLATAIKDAYEKTFKGRLPVSTNLVVAELLPFTANVEYNKAKASEVLALLKDPEKLTAVVEFVQGREAQRRT